jgi:hypothetical protein
MMTLGSFKKTAPSIQCRESVSPHLLLVARGRAGAHSEQAIVAVRNLLLARGFSPSLPLTDEDIRTINLAGYLDTDEQRFR